MDRNVVLGVSPDMPIIENDKGGRQSDTPYGFNYLPPSAIFATAQVAKYGANKYGAENYKLISPEEHINHCIQHLYAYMAGDQSDEHLSHAIIRAMFAYDVDKIQRGGAVG